MTSWADDEFALELVRKQLADRYPGEVVEILQPFDIAYSGWECEYQGALIMRAGAPEIVICDRIGGDSRPDIDIVREQLAEYKRLIADTERVLERYRELGGALTAAPVTAELITSIDLSRRPAISRLVEDYDAVALADARNADRRTAARGRLMSEGLFGDGTGRLWRLRQHAGESDELYAARVQKFAKVTIKIVGNAPAFEQVGWIEQDRRLLKSEIAQLEADLTHAREQLEKAEKYLDAPGDGEKP